MKRTREHAARAGGKLVDRVKRVEFHRNGIQGASFYRVDFVGASWSGIGFSDLVAIVFATPDHVAVFDPLSPESRFRGDNYEPLLREAIENAEEDTDAVCDGHEITGLNGESVSVTIPGCDCSTNAEHRGRLQVQVKS